MRRRTAGHSADTAEAAADTAAKAAADATNAADRAAQSAQLRKARARHHHGAGQHKSSKEFMRLRHHSLLWFCFYVFGRVPASHCTDNGRRRNFFRGTKIPES